MNRTAYNSIICGLLVALSIVLTRVFSAQFLVAGVPASRLSAGSVPIILASLIAGPVWGMATGALADVLGFVMFPSGAYTPLITLTSMMVGLLPALVVRLTGKTPDWAKVLLSICATQILCSALLQTWFLGMLFGKGFAALFLPRAIVSVVMIPVFYFLIYAVLLGLRRAKLIPQRLGERAEG